MDETGNGKSVATVMTLCHVTMDST